MSVYAVHDDVSDVDETQPLLSDVEGRTPLLPRRRVRLLSTLPMGQLLTLCALRLADPVAFTQIFPYVNEMMERLGVAADPSQAGFYSGVVESVFAISQLVSIYQWANLSDHIGRRPVVLLGTLGIAITTISLGFSRTLLSVLVTRSLAGLFSGNVAVMHSVLGELTDSSTQAVAFPIYGLCWPLGVIIGPLIGGTFSNPAQKYPQLFDNSFFITFPYLLPCIVVSALILVASLNGFVFLRETLPPQVCLPSEYSISYGISKHNDNLLRPKRSSGIRSLMALPIMRALCLSGFELSFVGTAFDVLFVLFCYSPITSGGLSFTASQIGCALAIAGLSSASIQLLILPYLLQTFNCTRLYTFCMGLWPFTFLLLPVLNLIARSGFDQAASAISGHVRASIWVGIAITLALSRIACLAFALNMILVKENAPGPTSLGSANGLAQFFQCLARAIAPAFVSSLFAFSINLDLMNGYLWVAIIFVLSCASWIHSYSVPEDSKTCDTFDVKDS